ncbi:MAG: TolC family outer membrane protein [Rhodospirillaceae bacterium]|nr:TolC family outer membrane protein [Rhodospirillaceae bacterium]
MTHNRILLTLVLASVSICVVTSVQAAALRDELVNLLANHPLIQSSKFQVQSADQNVRASLSRYLPTLDLTADAGQERISTPPLRLTPNGPSESGTETWGLSLTQNIYDGGLKSSNRTSSKLQRDVADITLTSVRQGIMFEGIAAYLDVLRQAQLLNLSTQNEENIRRQLNLEDERVRRGSGIAVDVLQAKSRLQIALERKVFVQGAQIDARSRYLQVFSGQPDPASMRMPASPSRLLPSSLEDAISIALVENPAIKSGQRQIEIADQSREGVVSEYYPTIDIVAEGNYEDDFNGVPGIRRDYSLKVRANWNLFNGLSTKSRAKGAAYTYQARQSDYVQTRRKIEEQTRLSWQALMTARERVELLDNAVNIAGEVFESRERLRESGRETALNVLDAENEVFNARINYTSALFDARASAFQLLLAMGRLDQVIGRGR